MYLFSSSIVLIENDNLMQMVDLLLINVNFAIKKF